jgi:hypothetical protein
MGAEPLSSEPWTSSSTFKLVCAWMLGERLLGH